MISSAMGQEVIQIHIDHGGLHCPHLGPKFKERFTELESVDSVYVDSENSIGTLYLKSGGELGDDQIRDVVVHKVGYPEPEIKAIIRNED
ncbi:MAG: hypothetical protein GC178_03535 [Flavobacteriales bacterium]|nr:hypothetical protein [Flavobacteriales bacterium]